MTFTSSILQSYLAQILHQLPQPDQEIPLNKSDRLAVWPNSPHSQSFSSVWRYVWLQTEDRYDLVRGRLALPTPLNPMTPRSLCHELRCLPSRFVFDVYCPCCLTLFHTRQRVFSHLVEGQRRCLHTMAVSVEPAPGPLAQHLLDQDRRVRKVSKHLSLEWHPKHLPAIRVHGPLQSWAHRLGRWSSP